MQGGAVNTHNHMSVDAAWNLLDEKVTQWKVAGQFNSLSQPVM